MSLADAPLAKRSLEAVRQHLGMDVAYVSEFVGTDAVYREVDAPGLGHLIAAGDKRSLSDVYCLHILEGRLPEHIPDTSQVPAAAKLPITQQVPIGAHVSVPIRHANGDLYGMFCCLSATPKATLNERDLHIVRAFAGLVAEEIEREARDRSQLELSASKIEQVIAAKDIAIHLQPVCTLSDSRPIGFEALARFSVEPVRPPDIWFAEAAKVHLGTELELAAIAAALPLQSALPSDVALAINACPSTVVDQRFHDLLWTPLWMQAVNRGRSARSRMLSSVRPR